MAELHEVKSERRIKDEQVTCGTGLSQFSTGTLGIEWTHIHRLTIEVVYFVCLTITMTNNWRIATTETCVYFMYEVWEKRSECNSTLTSRLHCSNTDRWRPWISLAEAIESLLLKTEKPQIHHRNLIDHLTSPQCLTAFQIGPALLGNWLGLAHSWRVWWDSKKTAVRKDVNIARGTEDPVGGKKSGSIWFAFEIPSILMPTWIKV